MVIQGIQATQAKGIRQTKAVSFGRELSPVEKIENRIAITEAEKALGIKNIALITHSPSLPAREKEDTGIGVLALTEGTKDYLDFAYQNGINSISIEPTGIIYPDYYCPYDSSVFSKKAIVDLKALTTEEWGKILPTEEFTKIVDNKNYDVKIPVEYQDPKTVKFSKNKIIYDYSTKAHKEALKIAFDNFKSLVEEQDPTATKLNDEFNKFKNENNYWLAKDALYLTLSDIHGSNYYPEWDNKLHQELFNENSKTFSKQEREEEVQNLVNENPKEVEFNKFCQFVVNKQIMQLAEYSQKLGETNAKKEVNTIQTAYDNGEIQKEKKEELLAKIKQNAKNSKISIIADRPVGFSNMDIWANKDLFSKDEFMGAPPDMFSATGQAWGFKFITRDKLFNEDGSLGEGGNLLKNLFKKTFKENPGGVRIDHVLGLIDPWTYTAEVKDGSRYLFKTMLNKELKELRAFGINEETIKGIADPTKALFDDGNQDRDRLKQNMRKQGFSENVINQNISNARNILIKQEPLIKTEYAKILNDIVMGAAIEILQEKQGDNLPEEQLKQQAKSMLICEDLGILTIPSQYWVLKNGLNLNGMRLARYADPFNGTHMYRECNQQEQGHYWSMGTHDDSAMIDYVNGYSPKDRHDHSTYIARELGIDENKLKNNPWEFVRAKFARMLAADKNPQTPNNILVMWTDFLGKNIRYNTPGVQDKERNWNERIEKDYFNAKFYDETLPSKKGINMTESLLTAMQSMDDNFKRTNKNLMDSLNKFANILNEKP